MRWLAQDHRGRKWLCQDWISSYSQLNGNPSAPASNCHILIPRIREFALVWNKGICRIIQDLEVRSPWISVGLLSMTSVPRGGEEKRHRDLRARQTPDG